jgi:hypothetical protein
MSTRSRIGYVDPKTGLIHSSYCHFDGYPSHVGMTLKTHYKDLKKIRRLIALGSISCLGQHVSWRTAPKPWVTQNYYGNGDAFTPVTKHTFDTPIKDVTRAYHRDRNEPWDHCKPSVDSIMLDLQEWNYLYDSGEWRYKMSGGTWQVL